MGINARVLNDTIEAHVAPLRAQIEALQYQLETLRSASEVSGAAGKMRKGNSAQAPRYAGQYKYLLDKEYPAYGDELRRWRKFSDDSLVEEDV